MQPASLPFAAGGTIYTAPVGTVPGESGWQRVGYTSLDGGATWFDDRSKLQPWNADKLASIQDRINEASREYYSGIPQRWLIGMPPPGGYEIKTASQEALDLYFGKTATINERSKPMGLTRNHEYEDADGDTVEVQVIDVSSAIKRGAIALLATDSGGAYVEPATAIPLALNVLGFDRPSAELYATGPTEYNGKSANTAIPSSQEQRDANVALAIDYLIGADIYDQRVAERKAKNAEWQERVAAEAKAREAAAKERAAEHAKEVYVSAIIEQHQTGVTAESVARVQAALSAYETARRKHEDLPH